MALLSRASVRYLTRHPFLMGLSVLGVAIGVAVAVSIDLANTSAMRAFELSAETVTGKATHQIVGATGPLDEEVYRHLRVQTGVRPSAPVVEGYASLVKGDRTFQVVGIDPFADGPFRPYLGTTPAGDLDLGAFMTQDLALMSAPTAHALSVRPGDTLRIQTEGRTHSVLLGGLVEPDDARTRQALANLLVVDVSTAQRLFGMAGQLSRIDLIVPSEETSEQALLSELRTTLPQGTHIQRSERRTETVEQMTRAFDLNLTALSLLALVVGAFLIYNTMTFSVVQRRTVIGRLRALGVTRTQVFRLVLGEACLLGAIGTALGLLLGIVLASGLVTLLARTINDLYFVVQVSELSIQPGILVKGGLLGIGTTVLAALGPSWEATSGPVRLVLQRSSQETEAQTLAPHLATGGVVLAGFALVLLLVSEHSLLGSYGALFGFLAAAALCTPLLVVGFARALRPLLGRIFGVVGRMAARGLVTNLSRTGVAIAALTIAVAATVGVGLMIDSFRGTVEDWLTQSLQADVYVQPPSQVFRRAQGTLDSTVIQRLRAMEAVTASYSVRRVRVEANVGPTDLLVVEPGPETEKVYRFKAGGRETDWRRFREGESIFISEPYSYRQGLNVGDTLRLQTDRGWTPFTVGGVFYDYASDLGVVMMSRSTYTQVYDDRKISGLAFYTSEGTDLDALVADMRAEVTDVQRVLVRSNRALRETSLEVFDRAFTIATVLRILTVIVALIGVLTALMALELERRRELGVLRATGMTPAQLGGYVTLQSGLMGTIAGLLSLPLGYGLAYVLVFVINKRSFGWTLQLTISWEILAQALLLAVGAAVLAGAYPAWRMARSQPTLSEPDE